MFNYWSRHALRVVDPSDRDHDFADGAGANIGQCPGVFCLIIQLHMLMMIFYLFYGKSYNPDSDQNKNTLEREEESL